ncbi:hypothetical protein ES707_08386 [subsurface metagenome]
MIAMVIRQKGKESKPYKKGVCSSASVWLRQDRNSGGDWTEL